MVTGRYPNIALANTGGALNRGWEGALRWRANQRVAVNLGYAYLRSTNLGPYLPRQKLNYAVEFNAGRAFFHLGGMSVGRRWANTGRTAELAAYTLGTLKCTVPVRDRVSLFVMVDNLFDRRYEVVTGYPMPGINAVGGFNLHF